MIGFVILGILMLIWVLTWDEPGSSVPAVDPGEHNHA
jgi:hypothetical protein